MNALLKARLSGKKSSQVIVLLMLALVVLILFLGFTIDIGFAYLTKSNLSKAVDSAALLGALSLGQGQNAAATLARNMFSENYRTSSRDSAPPVVTITFTTNSQNNVSINVSATAQPRTFFVRILPQWRTLTVSSSAQGTRGRAIICLVLDRSGSMKDNGGAAAMCDAITNSFLPYFDDNRDEVALVTFATTPNVDVQMPTNIPPQNFKAKIANAVNSLYSSYTCVNGVTFSQGGLTNALVQMAKPTINSGENVLKAVVFFTDGKANTIQNGFSCYSGVATQTIVNISSADQSTYVYFFNPILPETFAGQDPTNYLCQISNNQNLNASHCNEHLPGPWLALEMLGSGWER